MTAEIIKFPSPKIPKTLKQQQLIVDSALNAALRVKWTDVVCLGFNERGDFELISNCDSAGADFLVGWAKKYVFHHDS